MSLDSTIKRLNAAKAAREQYEREAPARRQAWENDLDELYASVKSYLADYIKDEEVIASENIVSGQLYAEGDKYLTLQIGDKTVTFKPKVYGESLTSDITHTSPFGEVQLYVRPGSLEFTLTQTPEPDSSNAIWTVRELASASPNATVGALVRATGLKTYDNVPLTEEKFKSMLNSLLS